jgi:hypothetical protein
MLLVIFAWMHGIEKAFAGLVDNPSSTDHPALDAGLLVDLPAYLISDDAVMEEVSGCAVAMARAARAVRAARSENWRTWSAVWCLPPLLLGDFFSLFLSGGGG